MSLPTITPHLSSRLSQLAAQRGCSLDQLLEDLLNSEDRLRTEISQQVNQQVAERIEHLRLVTDHATDMICLHEPDGVYRYISPASKGLLGYMPEELLGLNPYAHFHPEDLKDIKSSHHISLQGEPVGSVTYRFRTKSGAYIWLETATRPIVEDGVVKALVTVSRDITERIQMQEALRQERDLLTRIMETSPAGITVVDRNGQITFTNKRAEEIHGVPRDQVAERTYDAPEWRHTDYDGNPWPDEKQPFTVVMQTKQPVYDVRHAIEWSDGRKVYLAINGAPLFDEQGEIIKVVFTLEDYTQRKLQEDQIEAALEHEKRLNELRSKIISTVSHEFRTPLAVIMTSTSLLRMPHKRMNEEQLLARLDRIDEQVKRLASLLDDVTFMNKSQQAAHRLNYAAIDLPAFFERLVMETKAALQNDVQVTVVDQVVAAQVTLDEALLHQICSNLLSNAMKYSKSGGHVSLTYQCSETHLEITVTDDGIGIPDEDQAHIYDSFHRSSNVGMISGTGLGLPITKHAVELLGGTITFESAEGSGSTFKVTIPIKRA